MDFVEQRRRLMQVSGPVTELKEVYLPVDDLVFPDCKSTTAGYVDCVLVNHDQTYAELLDWKFGSWAVEDAKNNLQGIAYTLGLFKKFPSLKSVHVFFKQPLIGHLSDALFTREQVPALYLRVQVVVARSRRAAETGTFETANPTVPVCNFCGNLGDCPKVFNLMLNVAKKFHPLEFPESITPTSVMAPDQTSKALSLAAVAKIWAEAFRRQVTDRVLRQDMQCPEDHSIQTMRKRELVDAAKFKEVALRYMTEEQYNSALDVSFGAIESVVSDAAPRGSKSAAVADFQEALEASGAVKKGDPFSFLRVKNKSKEK